VAKRGFHSMNAGGRSISRKSPRDAKDIRAGRGEREGGF